MENQWELDKENVQHSKAGRSVEQLNISLAQSHSEDHQKYLKNKRQELELAIRSYSGDDPLLPYIDYVTWTEENYPSGGKDSQLYDLLKKCIKAFSQDKRYHQDARYINIFIAFAELEESKAAVTYDFMFHRGIGTMVSYFWYSFALALERRGDLKAAGEKYEHGIRCRAHPLDFLTEKFELFKRRLGHQAGLQSLMLDGNDTQIRTDSVLDPQQQLSSATTGSSRTRKALAALRATAGGGAPVMRIGNALSRDQSGLYPSQQQQQSAAASGNRNPSAPFIVPASAGVADENGVASSVGGRQRQRNGPEFDAVSEGHKENAMEPRPWNERGGLQESRRRDAIAAAAAAEKPTTLQVHEDEISQPAAATAPTPASAYRRGLSECAPKKPRPGQDETSPSKLFSGFEQQQQQQQQLLPTHLQRPGERFMCQIDKLYMGLQEVCFEELRAAVRHPQAVPLQPPSTLSKQSQLPPVQWPQPPPPPPPLLQQQYSREQWDRSQEHSREHSRDQSRDQPPEQQLQRQLLADQSGALRESAAKCRRLAASNDALVRCREQLEQRVAELEHRLALATDEASRERADREALIRQVAELEDKICVMYRDRTEFSETRARLEAELLRVERIQDDLEQRDAQIQDLRCQVQQLQQQQLLDQQQQQQQQVQPQIKQDSRTPMRVARQPPSSLAAPSPTVNTKEAFAQLQSLFRDSAPPRYPRELESMLVDDEELDRAAAPPQPPLSLQKQQQQQQQQPAFQVFCDQSLMPPPQQPAPPPQQNSQPSQRPAFDIFCDQSLLVSQPQQRQQQHQFKPPPPPQMQPHKPGDFKVPAPPGSGVGLGIAGGQQRCKKGLALHTPVNFATAPASLQRPEQQQQQQPADQTMSAAAVANLFGGGSESVIEFTPSSQSTQIIRNPVRLPQILGSLSERSSGGSSASASVVSSGGGGGGKNGCGSGSGGSGIDQATLEADSEQHRRPQQSQSQSQASIENMKVRVSSLGVSRFAVASASESSTALTVVEDEAAASIRRRRESPSSSCRRTLVDADDVECETATKEAEAPSATKRQSPTDYDDDTLAAFGIRASVVSSTMSATCAAAAAAAAAGYGFSGLGDIGDDNDDFDGDENSGCGAGAPNQTTIDLSATHTICVSDAVAAAGVLHATSALNAIHLALQPDLPFSQQSARLWCPSAEELKAQFAKDIVRGFGTNPFINLRRNARSIVHGSFHYKDITKLASGAFGEVYTANERKLVLKWQSPPLLEEFLLIRLAHQRLSGQRWPDLPDCRPGLCDAVRVHAFKEATVLVQTCYSTGSLLHLVNRCITDRSRLPEPVVAYISLELLYLVCTLHRARLLHADIKPDNLVFLGLPDLRPVVEAADGDAVIALPPGGRLHSVLLLDFGQAMEFSRLTGDGFILRRGGSDGGSVGGNGGGGGCGSRAKASATFLCPQMLSSQLWTCQCDLFNLASVIYCLIFQSYMTVSAGEAGVRLQGAPRLPRGWSAEVWPDLLHELMNSQSELSPSSLARHAADLSEIIRSKYKEYAACYNRPPIAPPYGAN